MRSAAAVRIPVSGAPLQATLLELVQALGEVTDDDREVVATLIELLRSGRVQLCGNFRGVPVEKLF